MVMMKINRGLEYTFTTIHIQPCHTFETIDVKRLLNDSYSINIALTKRARVKTMQAVLSKSISEEGKTLFLFQNIITSLYQAPGPI